MRSDTDQQIENEKFRALLKQWMPDATLPPRFEEQVWLRIARAETEQPASLVSLLWQWLTAKLARPAVAVSYLSVLLLVGVGAGSLQGRAEAKQNSATLRQQYLQMLEPFARQGSP